MLRSVSFVVASSAIVLLTACGSGDGESAKGSPPEANGNDGDPAGMPSPEEIRKLAEEGRAGEIIKRTREAALRRATGSDSTEPVDLPSVRRLKGFLPESLPGREIADFDMSENANFGICEAEGSYRTDGSYQGLELNIRYFGAETLPLTGFRMQLSQFEETTLKGLPAFLHEPDSGDREVIAKVTEALYVHAEGPMGMDELKQAVAAVDLEALGDQLESGELFKPGFEDRLSEKILSRTEIEKLVPAKIGTLERKDARSRREVDEDPMQSSVETRYGTGQLKIQDFGTAERADKAVSRDMEGDQDLKFLASQYEFTSSESKRDGADVYQLVGELKNRPGQQALIRLRVFYGRFVVSYKGTWAPAKEIDTSNPMAAQIKKNMEAMGIGVFPSVEAQVAAVLEALPFEAMKTWNEQEI